MRLVCKLRSRLNGWTIHVTDFEILIDHTSSIIFTRWIIDSFQKKLSRVCNLALSSLLSQLDRCSSFFAVLVFRTSSLQAQMTLWCGSLIHPLARLSWILRDCAMIPDLMAHSFYASWTKSEAILNIWLRFLQVRSLFDAKLLCRLIDSSGAESLQFLGSNASRYIRSKSHSVWSSITQI